ncbi:MAG: hypothetical protein ACT6S0_04690 [Roseateles sp.]|uniref:hypothetical protein n=1 Tax=Roseateles sp. TaxID=1971397 RepID=UPI004035C533
MSPAVYLILATLAAVASCFVARWAGRNLYGKHSGAVTRVAWLAAAACAVHAGVIAWRLS